MAEAQEWQAKIPVGTDPDIVRLRTALRDLVALSTVPAAWVGREPPAIADGLADVLVRSLHLDFAFVRLCDPNGGGAVEVTRGNGWRGFPEWLSHHLAAVGQFSRKEIIPDAGAGVEPRRGIVIPIGVNGDGGLVAAACKRTGFPDEIDQLLLLVGANHAATAFQSSRLMYERRQAEEALRESEHRWRSLTEALPQLVWAARPDGECDYFSTQWTEYTGVPESELLGWRWMDALHPDDREPTRQFWTGSVAGHRPYDVEYRVRRRDGVYGWFKARGVPIRDSQGEIVKWFGTCTDITDLRQAEQALRQSEQELRKAHNELELKVAERTADLRRSEAYLAEGQRLTHCGSFAWNVHREGLYWSDETYRIFECDEATEPTLEFILQRTHPEDKALVRQVSNWARNEKMDFHFEHRLLMPNGSVKHVEVMAHAVGKDESDNFGFVGTVLDVTERKRAEEERERLRQVEADLAHVTRMTTMGELTASLAHEIKQPIAAAVTDAKTCLRWLARDQPDTAGAREAASRTVKDAMRASDIINRIHLLFKKGEPERQSVDVNEVIREMIVLLRNEAIRYSISIRTELAENLPKVMADRVQLQQVLMNLMLNGIDAMKDMSPAGELTIRSGWEDGQLLISVSDTGVGLPPEPDQIFNAFFTTKPKGTGMGLTISRSIVESHGGRLWVTANSGRGATFQFTLPGEVEVLSRGA